MWMEQAEASGGSLPIGRGVSAEMDAGFMTDVVTPIEPRGGQVACPDEARPILELRAPAPAATGLTANGGATTCP